MTSQTKSVRQCDTKFSRQEKLHVMASGSIHRLYSQNKIILAKYDLAIFIFLHFLHINSDATLGNFDFLPTQIQLLYLYSAEEVE